MEALFRKYFWLVNVGVVVLMAYLVAGVASTFLADQIFSVPQEAVALAARSNGGEKPTIPGLRAPEGGSPTWATDLASRNVFNADRALDSGEKAAEEAPPEEEKAEAGTDQKEVEECTLQMQLMGTLVAADPADSLATVQFEGKSKIIWTGADIKKTPEDETAVASVSLIAPRHILLREGSKVCAVKLWAAREPQPRPGMPGAPGPGGRPGMPMPPQPPTGAQGPGDKTDFSQGVKKVSEYKYELDRKMLDEQLNDLSALGTQARVVPNYRNGKYQGFKLIGVRPNSLYRAIGIHSGDIVKSINGEEINTPNKAIQLFEKLRNSGNIKLDIERRGQTQTLDYSIR